MCNEYYRRRRRDEEESRAIWQEFERVQPLEGRESPAEATEPEPTELREAIATPER